VPEGATRAEMEALGAKVWGPLNRKLSNRNEMRFGSNGSKSIDVQKAVWHDHEAGTGGGYRDLQKLAGVSAQPASKMNGGVNGSATEIAYNYCDADGTAVFQVVRKPGKKFAQRRRAANGEWIWNLDGVTRVPYRLPQLLSAAPGARVFICEGEKDCDALADRLLIATTNPGGAGKWQDSFGPHLARRDLVLLEDNDEAGRSHVLDVARKLESFASEIRIVRLPGLPPKGDVSDWLYAGGTADELEQIAAAAPVWRVRDERPSAEHPTEKVQIHWAIINPVDLYGKPVPVRKWIVDQWLPIGAVTALYADGGVGKTNVAIQLQFSTSLTGMPWCGLAVTQCRSLGLYCEDDEDELHRRLVRMCEGADVDIRHLGAVRMISGMGQDNTLMEQNDRGGMRPTPNLAELRRHAKDHRATLLILDTAADLFDGNEVDRRQVRQFLGELNGLALELKAGVLLAAHPSRTGLKSGNLDGASTAWSNSVRSRWSLSRPQGDDVPLNTPDRVLTKRKANYAATGEEIRLREVMGILEPIAKISGLSAMVNSAEAEQTFLALLAEATASNRPVSDAVTAGNFAPRSFAKSSGARGFAKKDLNAAMERLFSNKKIIMEDYGRPGDLRRRIALAVAAAHE
jgi:RecA-family ATPase